MDTSDTLGSTESDQEPTKQNTAPDKQEESGSASDSSAESKTSGKSRSRTTRSAINAALKDLDPKNKEVERALERLGLQFQDYKTAYDMLLEIFDRVSVLSQREDVLVIMRNDKKIQKQASRYIEPLFGVLSAISRFPRSDWHQAIIALFQLEFSSNLGSTVFFSEVSLITNSPRIDLLAQGIDYNQLKPGILKNLLADENVRDILFEYKGPQDAFEAVTLTKTSAYHEFLLSYKSKEYDIQSFQEPIIVVLKYSRRQDSAENGPVHAYTQDTSSLNLFELRNDKLMAALLQRGHLIPGKIGEFERALENGFTRQTIIDAAIRIGTIEEAELDPSISGIQTGRMCGGYITRGIYRVTGLSWETPYYLIFTSELVGHEYDGFNLLCYHADKEAVANFIRGIDTSDDYGIRYARDIMAAISNHNADAIRQLYEEDDTMQDLFSQLVERAAREKLQKTENKLQQAENIIQQLESKLQQSDNKIQQSDNKLQQTENKLQQLEMLYMVQVAPNIQAGTLKIEDAAADLDIDLATCQDYYNRATAGLIRA